MLKKALLAAVTTAAFAAPVTAQNSVFTIYAITSTDTLLRIETDLADILTAPAPTAPVPSTTVIGKVTGIDSKLIGIDFRVQNGVMYGVSRQGSVYTIDTATGAATFVNSLVDGLGAPITPDGTRFGVDFNPAADRLRIVSNTGQNLRHNVNAGGITLVDGPLNNGLVPPAPVTGIAAGAYTNNDLTLDTATALYDINAANGQLTIQIPPNSGVINTVGVLGVGPTTGFVGMDIYSQQNSLGRTLVNAALITYPVPGGTQMFGVDLTSGAVGTRAMYNTTLTIKDIAIPLNQFEVNTP